MRLGARRVAATLASAAATFVLFTWWVLEASGVAVIATHTPEGDLRETHVWFVEPDGELWLEAGTPRNNWYLDVGRDPRVAFTSERRSGHYRAERIDAPGARDQLRARIRAKYGVRDQWVGLLLDTSRSVPVRLVPDAWD